MSIRIMGTGSALPGRVVENRELEGMVDTSDEWIRERTGIGSRHVSTGETVASLAAEACGRALADAGRQAEEVELILAATCSPEEAAPCVACRIQSEIGAGNAVAFDVNAACAGFLFALHTAWAYVEAGIYRNALIAGSEVLSKLVDWEDRATCILFGDGAGAVVLEWRDEGDAGILSSYMENSDDTERTLWCDSAFTARTVPFDAEQGLPEADAACDPYMRMAGQAVFKFATAAMVRCTEEALARAQLSVDDVALFAPHQANERIIRYAAKKMDLPLERFQIIIDHVGNVSGASALIALNEALCEGKLKQGDVACMAGFGGGLTAGACVFRI